MVKIAKKNKKNPDPWPGQLVLPDLSGKNHNENYCNAKKKMLSRFSKYIYEPINIFISNESQYLCNYAQW